MYPQGQILTATQDFGMKRSFKGRAAQVRKGDRFSNIHVEVSWY